jgi:hypothetical protein
LAVGKVHLEFLALRALDQLDFVGTYRKDDVQGSFLGLLATVDDDR